VRDIHVKIWASIVILAGVTAPGALTHGDVAVPGVAPGGVVREAPVMLAPRAAHSATTLLDGRILVAGGFTQQGSAPGAEVYEMDASRSSAAGPMLELRHSHTATRLPTGQVLLIGGYGEGGRTLASTELFDPRTNRFTPTGRLVSARANHIAVLLTTGQVLVAGGLGEGWTYLSTAELYEPTTGTFTATAPMTVARESHTAVRLDDGRVLVAGGHEGPRRNLRLHASAESYDPTTRRFRRVGEMVVRRHKHDAVLLRDGRVLITGGSDERDGDGAYVSTEFFDPGAGAFIAGPSMVHARYKHQGSALLLPTGDVLVAGGAATAEVYDARRNTFAAVPGAPRMPGLFSAVAQLGSGLVLITGGYGRQAPPSGSAWIYQP